MNFFKSYFIGLKTAISYPRVLITTYLVNLLLGSIFFLAIRSIFKPVIAHSKAFEPLLKEFNFVVLSDFVNNYNGSFATIATVTLGLSIGYWLVNIFLTGGILSSFRLQQFSMRGFFGGAGYNFFPFLLVDVMGWAILAILFVGINHGINYTAEFFELTNASLAFQFTALKSIVFGFLIILGMITITYAKVMLVLDQSVNFFTKFFRSLGFTFGRMYLTLPLMLLLLVLPAATVYGFFYLQTLFESTITASILIGFGIQQAFILLRVFFRIWILSTHIEFYDRKFYQPRQLAKFEKQQAIKAASK